MQKRAKSRAPIDPRIRSEIMRIIRGANARNEEVKHFISTYTDINPVYPTSILSPTVLDLRAVIPLGNDSHSRVGAHVRLKSYRFNCDVWASRDSTVQPALVRFVFCKMRGNPNTVPSLTQINTLKRSNASATTGIYTSTKVTQLVPYNIEGWEVLHTEDCKIGLAQSSSISAAGLMPNNDFSSQRTFSVDMSKFLKHDIQFDDSTSTSNIQINDGVYCLVMCLDVTELVPVASATTPRCDISIDMEYTDA